MRQKPDTEGERLLRPKEFAQRLSVCPRTVRRWHLAGIIDAVVLSGRVVRYRESEIARLIQEGRVSAPSAGGAR